jgi:hypothetical protein
MLSTIVFSKDRPLQLDLTLNSIKKNLPLCNDIKVIYYASEKFEKSYGTLAEEHESVEFLNEELVSFPSELWTTVSLIDNPYLMFLTDDNIVYQPSKTTELDLGNLFARDIACLSLRLGVNITHRDGYPTPQPRFERVAGHHLIWNRMSVLAQDYFNYPLSVDGHIFKTRDIDKIITNLCASNNIKNPNKLEQLLQRYFFEVPALMACELHSCVVNSPNNRVQEEVQNWHGQQFPYDPSYLLELYNKGIRLGLDYIDFKNIVCPHTEIDILRNICQ